MDFLKKPHVQLFLICLLFLTGQAVKAAFFSPFLELGGDAVHKWFLARDFASFDLSNFDHGNHHHLRWGSWLFAFVLNVFVGDDVSVYFLSTLIPSTAAGLLFICVCYRQLGFFMAVFFGIFWFTDAQIYRATFQLLPTGQGLLPLALLGFSLLQLSSAQASKRVLLAILFCWFWLYGVKETNLFFTPGILLFVYFYGGVKAVRFLLIGMAVLYALECVFFFILSDGELILGRAWQLLFGDARTMNAMSTSKKLLAEQKKYFDNGITIRLYRTNRVQVLFNFLAPLLALFFLSQYGLKKLDKQRRFIVICSLLCLSFLLFTTIFIVSINPIRLGQPLRDRYIAIILPLAFILVLNFVKNHITKNQRAVSFGVFFLALLFLSKPIHHTRKHFKDKSIFERADRYVALASKLEDADCIRAKKRNKVRYMPRLIPQKHRTAHLQKFISKSYKKKGRSYFVRLRSKCKNTYSLDKGW